MKTDHQQLNKFDWKLLKDFWAIMKPFWLASGENQKWYMVFFLTLVGGFTVPILTTIYAFYTAKVMGPEGTPVGVPLESLMPGALVWTFASVAIAVFLLGFKRQLVAGKRFPLLWGGLAAVSVLGGAFLGFGIPWLVLTAVAVVFLYGNQKGILAKYGYIYTALAAIGAYFAYDFMTDAAVLPQVGGWITSLPVATLSSWMPWIFLAAAIGAPAYYGWKNYSTRTRMQVLNFVGLTTGLTLPVVRGVIAYWTGDFTDVSELIAGGLPYTFITLAVMGFVYGFKILPSARGDLEEKAVDTAQGIMNFAFAVLGTYLFYSFVTPIAVMIFGGLAGAEIPVHLPWLAGALAILTPACYMQIFGDSMKARKGGHRMHLVGILTGLSIPVFSLIYANYVAFTAAGTDTGSLTVADIQGALSWTAATIGFITFMHSFKLLPYTRETSQWIGNRVVALSKFSTPIYVVAFAAAAFFGATSIDGATLASIGNAITPGDSVKLTFSILLGALALGAPTLYLFVNKKMDSGWRLLAILTALLFSVTGFNVLLTYLMRDMWNALQVQDAGAFWFALYTVGAIFIVGVFIVVPYRYVRDKLGLEWRLWLSKKMISKYMAHRNYYKISQQMSVDNPEQRISQDIRHFCSAALAFLLMVLDSVLVIAAFAVVLFSISPLLTYTVLIYAVVGSVLMGFIGKRLIGLNFRQEELEANFYYQAVHVRNNSEAIAFFTGEEMEKKGLFGRLEDALANFSFVIRWERNMQFFAKGYDYLVVILPLAIVAPLYFAGDASFGEIQQANSAFSQILAAISLFVAQFTSVTSFAAYIKRLRMFDEELEKPDPSDAPGAPVIERQHGADILVEDLTLMTPNYVHTLIRNLNLEIREGESILVMGPSGSGKSSLLRGISGLWVSGDGKVTTPDKDDMMFMPQRAYLAIGSLRWQFQYPANLDATDDDIRAVLKEVNLDGLIERFAKEGGLDAVLKWDEKLSGGEQQRVAMARLLLAEPKYAIVDEASSALDEANEEHLYSKLKASGTTYISVGHRKTLLKYHDRVLYLNGDGTWDILNPEDPKVLRDPDIIVPNQGLDVEA